MGLCFPGGSCNLCRIEGQWDGSAKTARRKNRAVVCVQELAFPVRLLVAHRLSSGSTILIFFASGDYAPDLSFLRSFRLADSDASCSGGIILTDSARLFARRLLRFAFAPMPYALLPLLRLLARPACSFFVLSRKLASSVPSFVQSPPPSGYPHDNRTSRFV